MSKSLFVNSTNPSEKSQDVPNNPHNETGEYVTQLDFLMVFCSIVYCPPK